MPMASAQVQALRSRGVEIMGVPMNGDELPQLENVLKDLSSRREVAHVFVEAGGGLMSSLFQPAAG